MSKRGSGAAPAASSKRPKSAPEQMRGQLATEQLQVDQLTALVGELEGQLRDMTSAVQALDVAIATLSEKITKGLAEDKDTSALEAREAKLEKRKEEAKKEITEAEEKIATAKEELQQAVADRDRTARRLQSVCTVHIQDYHGTFSVPFIPGYAFDFVAHQQYSTIKDTLVRMLKVRLGNGPCTKADFYQPVINGGMGSGKSRTAWEACEAAQAELLHSMGKKVAFRHLYMDQGLISDLRNGASALASAVLRAFCSDNGIATHSPHGVIEWIKRTDPELDAIILIVDEYQTDPAACARIVQGCADFHERSIWAIPVYSVLCGTASAELDYRVRQSSVHAMRTVVLQGLTEEPDLARMRASFLKHIGIVTLPSVEAGKNLDFLIRDLGGFPRFYEYLAFALKECNVDLSKGLGLDTAKVVLEHLVEFVRVKYSIRVWLDAVAADVPALPGSAARFLRVKRFFESVLVGELVKPKEHIADEPGAPTYEQLASSGLVSLASRRPVWAVCRTPLVVVMGVNIDLWEERLVRPASTPALHIVHPDDMNPFHHHWQKLESLSMETFRVFSNILADRSASRVVRLDQVRRGAFFGPGARDVVFEVPKGGLPAVVTLAHALAPASAGWLAEKRKTEADGRGEDVTLWDRAVLARPNQAGIDGLVGLTKAGSVAPVAAAAAAVSSASSSALSSTQDPVLNGSLLVLSQSKCTEILSEPGSALTPHVAAQLDGKARKEAGPIPPGCDVVVDLFTVYVNSITKNHGQGEDALPPMCVATTRANLLDVAGPIIGQRARLFLEKE